jgi:hypothetical protein
VIRWKMGGRNHSKQLFCSSRRFVVYSLDEHPSLSVGPVYFGALMEKVQIDPVDILPRSSLFEASALRPVDGRLWVHARRR